jgi:hypothetical protein
LGLNEVGTSSISFEPSTKETPMDRNSSFNVSNQFDSKNGQASNGTSKVSDTSAKAVATEVAQNAKEVANDFADRARSMVGEQVSSAKQMAADRIGGVADALRATGDQLRSQGTGEVGNYVDQAVDKLDQASSYLQTSTFSELVSDVGAFARREPAIVFGSAFVIGMLAGRFLKSSSTPKMTPMHGESGTAGATNIEGRSELGRLGQGDKSFVPGVV